MAECDVQHTDRTCRDCGQVFPWPADAGEGAWFRDRAYPDPIRCPACRVAARRARGLDPAPDAPQPGGGIRRLCRECGTGFLLTQQHIAWFARRALYLPAHCSTCRRARRQAAQSAAGSADHAEG